MLQHGYDRNGVLKIENYISTEELNYPCYVSTLGRTCRERNVLWNLDKYLLLYSESGLGEAVIDGKPVPVRPGAVLLCCPESGVEYHGVGTAPWTTYWITFSGSHCGTLLPFESGVLRQGDYTFLRDTILTMKDRGTAEDWADDSSVRLYGLLLRIRHLQMAAENGAPTEALRNKLKDSMRYLVENFTEDIPLSKLAALSGVQEEYYCRLFKRFNGIRPTMYQNVLRIRRACDLLLAYPDRKIEEISAQVGYHSNNYFAKIFHRIVGITPSTYRKAPMNGKPVLFDWDHENKAPDNGGAHGKNPGIL